MGDLHPYFKNPRQLSENQAKQLKTSLDKFGLIDRPVINKNGTIIGGHQRLAVMDKFPEEEIEVMSAEFEQMRQMKIKTR